MRDLAKRAGPIDDAEDRYPGPLAQELWNARRDSDARFIVSEVLRSWYQTERSNEGVAAVEQAREDLNRIMHLEQLRNPARFGCTANQESIELNCPDCMKDYLRSSIRVNFHKNRFDCSNCGRDGSSLELGILFCWHIPLSRPKQHAAFSRGVLLNKPTLAYRATQFVFDWLGPWPDSGKLALRKATGPWKPQRPRTPAIEANSPLGRQLKKGHS